MQKKIVLGFSGGLDTTYCAKYLTQDMGYEVHSIIVNTGGFTAIELKNIEQHAYNLGVKTHTTVDAIENYYNRIIKYLVFGNCLKNNTYPLSVSAERLIQALHIAEHATKLEATAIAHGSTGAGNDQVRFDMIINILNPNIEIITPIRDMQLSREAEIEYLKLNNVSMELTNGEKGFEKSQYSINKGIWGTSVGGKETLKSNGMLPEAAWPTQFTATENKSIILEFLNGEFVGIDNNKYKHPTEAIIALQKIAASFAIGRDIHIGDTIIGIKGRVGFEAAAPMVIIKAHHALEKHILTKWQLQWKDTLAQFYANWLHEGQILDPVMRDIEAYFTNSQQNITGKVFVELMPYRFTITGIESKFDLMNSSFGTYGEMNTGYTGQDVKGFSKIFGNQVRIHQLVKNANEQ